MKLVTDWMTLSQEDNARLLRDDNIGPKQHVTFKEHRHDQSLWSLLAKRHKLHVSLDNYSDRPQGEQSMVVVPSRIRK